MPVPRTCSAPRFPASSRPATSARARPNAAPPPSAREPGRYSSSTPTWLPPSSSGHKWHELTRHGHERAHHVAVLVLEDVAVVHVPAAVGGEANGDLDDLVGVHADRVLEAAFVVIYGVLELVAGAAAERDGGGEVEVADAVLRDLVRNRPAAEDLERVEVQVD